MQWNLDRFVQFTKSMPYLPFAASSVHVLLRIAELSVTLGVSSWLPSMQLIPKGYEPALGMQAMSLAYANLSELEWRAVPELTAQALRLLGDVIEHAAADSRTLTSAVASSAAGGLIHAISGNAISHAEIQEAFCFDEPTDADHQCQYPCCLPASLTWPAVLACLLACLCLPLVSMDSVLGFLVTFAAH
jgi:hypothetical protein